MSADADAPPIAWLLDPGLDLPPARPRRRYVLVGSPRAGTTWVCDILAQTGQAGVPHEFLHPGIMTHVTRQAGGHFNPHDHLADMMRRRTTPNGQFGPKLFPAQSVMNVPAGQQAAFLDHVLGDFDRFVLMRRRDKIRQAVSFALADRTQHYELRAEAERAAQREARGAVALGHAELGRYLAAIVKEDQAAYAALATRNLAYLELYYEDLLADPEGEFGRLFSYLGIDAEPSAYTARTLVARDAATEAQVAAFKRYLAPDCRADEAAGGVPPV